MRRVPCHRLVAIENVVSTHYTGVSINRDQGSHGIPYFSMPFTTDQNLDQALLGINFKDKAGISKAALRWSPFRSLAAWYMYRLVGDLKSKGKQI